MPSLLQRAQGEIGNAVINDETDNRGAYDYLESHALISDKTLAQIHRYCDLSPNATLNLECDTAMSVSNEEVSTIFISLFAPIPGSPEGLKKLFK